MTESKTPKKRFTEAELCEGGMHGLRVRKGFAERYNWRFELIKYDQRFFQRETMDVTL